MRVRPLFLAVLAVWSCGGQKISLATESPPTSDTSTITGGDAMSTAGGGGPAGADNGASSTSGSGAPYQGCGGTDQTYKLCVCNQRGLVGLELFCCANTICFNDSRDRFDCPAKGWDTDVRQGVSCEWASPPAPVDLTCDALSSTSARYCKYPDPQGPGAKLASCVNSVWQVLHVPCPVDADDSVLEAGLNEIRDAGPSDSSPGPVDASLK
jgi:hypothetical protein